MKKYIEKRESYESEKVMAGARVYRSLLESFKEAKSDLTQYGYKTSFAKVVEQALIDSIKEAEEVTGKDYVGKVMDSMITRRIPNKIAEKTLISLKEMSNSEVHGHRKRPGRPPEDLTGRTFGRLTIRSCDAQSRKCICDCECGNVAVALSNNIKAGRTSSCGCLRKDTKNNLHRD